ncbi:MAG: alpha/beta fold hydrolase [Burkholderiales bacterium]|nr:alpha/beta fold hydrolase [Burkholderiales bacterium]
MPHLNFTRQGRGPMIVLSHALGCDLTMWDGVAMLLERHFSVLRYDHRGHGRSEVPPGPYSVEAMADDAAQLIAGQTEGPVHFVGASLGGMVAQQLAVKHPELVSSIVVANSSSHYDDTARALWKARIETVTNLGMHAAAEGTMARWFTREFRDQDPDSVLALCRVFESNSPRAYAASCEAVSRIDFGGTNPLIACPALVIAGLRDEASPLAMSEAICNTISGAELVTIDAAHLSAVEKPAEFAHLVSDFLGTL